MTESIIILSIRSALMYMVIIWIFQLWSQFIQFSSTKNISKIFDPIPLGMFVLIYVPKFLIPQDNATFYEMSGFKVAHKSVPRWTENPSVIKAKIVEMEKRPFNEFEQLDTTISIQFVYSCILGTLGTNIINSKIIDHFPDSSRSSRWIILLWFRIMDPSLDNSSFLSFEWLSPFKTI